MMIRTAQSPDALSIISLINNVYGWNSHQNKERWQKWESIVANLSQFYRLLEENNELVGVLYSGWRYLKYADQKLKLCDLSEICISKEKQQSGYGSILMKDFIERMNNNGIHLSRLHFRESNLIQFYEKHDYTLFKTMHVEVLPSPINQKPSSHIRLYDKNLDHKQCVELYNSFNKEYLGSLVWDKDQGNWNNKNRIIWEENRVIKGYFYADESFGQIAYDRRRPEIFIDMINWLHDKKSPCNIKLPRDPELMNLMNENGVSYSFKVISGDESHNMIKIINRVGLQSLIGQEYQNENKLLEKLFAIEKSTGGSELWGPDNLNLTKYPLE